MPPKSAISHEGYNKIVVLDEEYAYIQPKTEEAIEKLRTEIDVLGMVSDRVDIETPPYLGQDAEWLIFTKISGSIFSQEIQDSQTEKLLALASQGRHDVPQSGAEVVFLGMLKNREKQRVLACEHFHHTRRGTAGHSMPVDRRLRIAGAQRNSEVPIIGHLRRVDGVDAQQQQVAGPHLRSLHDLLDFKVLLVPVDSAPVGNVQGPPVTKRVQYTRARAPTEVEESRRLFAKPIPGNQAQSPLGARGLDQRNPVIEMSPIVLRQEEVIVILMKGKTDYRRLEIENLIERGLGSGDSLGKRFHARTYSLEGFFSSHYARTQRSRLTGNWPITKVLRRMLGFRWEGIVWACIEFFHEEVDLFTAEEFRDNAEAPFIERGGDCCKISHEYTCLSK